MEAVSLYQFRYVEGPGKAGVAPTASLNGTGMRRSENAKLLEKA